uniref:Uncharacterized protein n=1 Tax=Anguilla anguilla TaxID=7936 RepID=A0A0E9QA13_ANGAN
MLLLANLSKPVQKLTVN